MINKSKDPKIHAEAERYADGKVPEALRSTSTEAQRRSWQHFYDQRVEFLNSPNMKDNYDFSKGVRGPVRPKNAKPPPAGTPSPYLIHCVKDEEFGSCGQSSYLTEAQYVEQLGDPDKGWRCPNCNCYPCNWDDKNQEKWEKE